MVAIVTGNGAGVFNSSASVLGQQGIFRDPAVGTTKETAYVNVSNGNLVLRDQDDFLASRGLGVALARTYNSQGNYNDGLSDDWKLGLVKQITGLTGVANTKGSTVTRIDSDGSASLFVYDADKGAYFSSDGAGSYQRLTSDGQGKWTWTSDRQDQTGDFEVYDSSLNDGRIQSSGQNGEKLLTYTYNADKRLASVTAASGETTNFHYDANGRITSVGLKLSGSQAESTRSYYSYDDQGRLASVTIDLTPQDGNVADKSYKTSYQYDGTSNRIASITQPDGTKTSFTYQQVGADYRIASVTDGLGARTTFDYSVAGRTTVTDPMGVASSYVYDTLGQLTAVNGPKVGGVATGASFDYDAQGNVLGVTDALGFKTVYKYDANGNRVYERGAAGNTVTRVYDLKSNQLLSETRYTSADPDGEGEASATQPLTTRYVYDTSNRLRFVIGADGEVKEYTYNALNQQSGAITYLLSTYAGMSATPSLSDMTAWTSSAAVDAGHTRRVSYAYDARGQLAVVTTYAPDETIGSSITRYTYDQAGMLLQSVDGDGNATSYTYDGLGRMLSSTNAAKQTTTVSYNDGNNSVVTQLASGLVTTTVYDARGAVLSTTNTAGTAQLNAVRYAYDNAGRLRQTVLNGTLNSFVYYDAAGRKTGEVDSGGYLTEYFYNADNRVTCVRQYADKVTAALADANGNWLNLSVDTIRPTTNTAANRNTWNVYDAAGRLYQTVDAKGLLTTYEYDGRSNLTSKTESAAAVDLAKIGTATGLDKQPVTKSDANRQTFYYYDSDDHLVGTIDPDGYATEQRYAGSLLVETIGYAAKRTGAAATAMPTGDTSAGDIHVRNFYNARGLLSATVDGESYLTAYTYDGAGNLASKTRYAKPVLQPDAKSFSTLGIQPSPDNQTTTYTYTALNQLRTETVPDGTQTYYAYDANGKVTEMRMAYGTTDQRAILKRYDALGRVTAELSPVGAAALNSTNVESIWTRYGTTYTYNAAGLRLSMTMPGRTRTLYYYDKSGNLRYTINGAGEVVQRDYDAFGKATKVRTYVKRIAASVLSGLQGGQGDPSIDNTVAALASAGDLVESFVYDAAGELVQRTDGSNYLTKFTFDVFGQLSTQAQQNTAKDGFITTSFAYDKRGYLRETLPFQKENLASRISVDGFGRATAQIDAEGHAVITSYDRLGRIVGKQDGSNPGSSISYDAFNRVLSQTDSLGNTTSYAYDTATRSFKMTMPDGVVHTTTLDRLGQTIVVGDGDGNFKSFAYDQAGHLTKALAYHKDSNGVVTSTQLIEAHTYNNNQTVASDTDSSAVVTDYTYDSALRVLSRTFDSVGMDLVTLYTYDGAGNVLTVTDPRGIVTETRYDEQFRVKTVIEDANGAKRTTGYTYDSRGNVATITDPSGGVTRISESEIGFGRVTTVLGTGANPTEQLIYDKTGTNVLVRITGTDPAIATRYAYDSHGLLACQLDADGTVTAYRYDSEKRLVGTTRYATRSILIKTETAPTQVFSASDILATVNPNDPANHNEQIVYDENSRVFATIDSTGLLTVNQAFDAAGNVTDQVTYARHLSVSTAMRNLILTKDQVKTMIADQSLPQAVNDQHYLMVYDYRGRLSRSFTALAPAADGRQQWKVDLLAYDSNSNVTERSTFGPLIGDDPRAAIGAYLAASPVPQASVQMVYDEANRMTESARFVGVTDPDGTNRRYAWSIAQQKFDDDGNVLQRVNFLDLLYTDKPGVDFFTISNFVNGRTSGTTAANATYPPREVVSCVYDNANRVVASATSIASSSVPGSQPVYTWAVTQNQYDANGRLTGVTAFADTLTSSTFDGTVLKTFMARAASGGGQAAGVTEASNPDNQVTRYVYDAAGRLTATAVAQRNDKGTIQWAVSVNDYDDNGRMIRQTAYEKPLASQSLATGQPPAEISVWLGTTAAINGANRVTRYVYDAAGRPAFVVSTEGAVTGMEYDTNGNIVAQTQYATVYTDGGNINHGFTPVADANNDRTTRTIYDQDNRAVFQIDAMGHVTQRVFDDLGHLIKVTQFATSTQERLPTPLTVASFTPPAATSGDRVVRYINDRLGRVQYTIDAANYVTETRYDLTGKVTDAIQYRDPVGDASADADIVKAVKAQTTAITTHYEYDSTGNLLSQSVSANDIATRTQRYTYDAQGNRKTFTNEAGNTWTYSYDLVGRLILESSPNVNSYSDDVNFSSGALLTQTDYDAFGNVSRRIEGASTPLARTTSYAYDLQNRQVLTTQGAIKVYDKSDALTAKFTPTDSARQPTRENTASETDSGLRNTRVVYNALGDALSSTDALQATSRKLYDRMGRVSYEIDAAGYVTGYQRDAFGEVTRVTRYATQPAATAYASTDAMRTALAALDASGNRSIDTSHDKLGRAVTTSEAAGLIHDQSGIGQVADVEARKVTATTYDSFGNVQALSSYGVANNGTTVTQATETRYAYDKRGNKTAEFAVLKQDADTAKKQGYVTEYRYDYAGRLTDSIEKAALRSGWSNAGVAFDDDVSGGDRGTRNVYDGAGNLVSVTQRHVQYVDTAHGGSTVTQGDLTTNYKYDVLGNQNAVIDALGAVTYTTRDVLGRIVAVAHLQLDPATKLQAGDSQLTLHRLDLLGNAVASIQRAKGATLAKIDPQTGLSDGGPEDIRYISGAASDDDRLTRYTYNSDGHIIQTVDAAGHASYISYDALGRVAKTWQTVTDGGLTEISYQVTKYDAVGHVVDSVTPGNLAFDQDASKLKPIHHLAAYNGFGEVTTRSIKDDNDTTGKTTVYEHNDYDRLGRLWRTDAGDGMDKVRLFDAQGRVTMQMVSADDKDPHALLRLDSADQAKLAPHLLKTETRYDLLGHVVDVVLPDTRLMVLQRTSGGAWVQVSLENAAPGTDTSLVVIRGASDQSTVPTLVYKKNDSAKWIDGGARVQTIDGYMVFNTAGLEGGGYDYQVSANGVLGTQGSLDIKAKASTTAHARILELYSVVLNAYPSGKELNDAVARLNSGVSLATIAADLLNTPAARARQSGSAMDVVTRIFEDAFNRGGPTNDPTYGADVGKWATRLGATGGTYTAAQAGQAIVDMINEVRNGTGDAAALVAARTRLKARAETGVAYFVTGGGNDLQDAKPLYASATSGNAVQIADAVERALLDRKRVEVAQLYVALLRRPPEPAGMDYWLARASVDPSNQAVLANGMLIPPDTDGGKRIDELQVLGFGKDVNDEQFVLNLFRTMLGRDPDSLESSRWVRLAATSSRGQAVTGLISEVANYRGDNPQALADRDFYNLKVTVALSFNRDLNPAVTANYSVEVGRAIMAAVHPGATVQSALDSAVANLQAQIDIGADATRAASTAADAMALQDLHRSLAEAYVVVLGRAPDKGGLDYWSDVISGKSASLEAVVTSIVSSPESTLSKLSNAEFVSAIYGNIGRAPSSGELAQWTNLLSSNTSRGKAALAIADSFANYSGTSVSETTLGALLRNRVAVAQTYGTVMGGNDSDIARTIIAKVTVTDTGAALQYGAEQMSAIIAQNITRNATAADAASKLERDAAAAVNSSIDLARQLDDKKNGAGSDVAVRVMGITKLYVGLLMRGEPGRPAMDFGGVSYYVQFIQSGASLGAVAQKLLEDSEGKAIFDPAQKPDEFVRQLFRQIVGRPAGDVDMAYWTGQLTGSRGELAAKLIASFETTAYDDTNPNKASELELRAAFENKVATALASMQSSASDTIKQANATLAAVDAAAAAASTAASSQNAAATYLGSVDASVGSTLDLVRLYVGVLNRGPGRSYPLDIKGLNYWLSNAKGAAPANIADMMLKDPEGTALYAGAISNVAFIAQLSQQVYGRAAGATETRYVTALDQGASRGAVAAQMIADVVSLNTTDPVRQADRLSFDQMVGRALGQIEPGMTSTAQQVADALAAAKNAAVSAQTSLDAAKKALDDAKAARVGDDASVKAADAAAIDADRVLVSPHLREVIELWTAYGHPITLSGLVNATNRFSASDSPGDVTVKLMGLAAESVGPYNPADPKGFLYGLYATVLKRQPDSAGLDFWLSRNLGDNAGAIAYNFFVGAREELNSTIIVKRPNFAGECSYALYTINTLAQQAVQAAAAARNAAQAKIADAIAVAQGVYDNKLAAYNQANIGVTNAQTNLDNAYKPMAGLNAEVTRTHDAFIAAGNAYYGFDNNPNQYPNVQAAYYVWQDMVAYQNSPYYSGVVEMLTAFGYAGVYNIEHYIDQLSSGRMSWADMAGSLANGSNFYADPFSYFQGLYSQVLNRPSHIANGEDEAQWWARAEAGQTRETATYEFFKGALPELYSNYFSYRVQSSSNAYASTVSSAKWYYDNVKQNQKNALYGTFDAAYNVYNNALTAQTNGNNAVTAAQTALQTAIDTRSAASQALSDASTNLTNAKNRTADTDPSVIAADQAAARARAVQNADISGLMSLMVAFGDSNPSVDRVYSLLGQSLPQIAANYVGPLTNANRESFVRNLYSTVLARQPDLAGLEYWVVESTKYGDGGSLAYAFYQAAVRDELSHQNVDLHISRTTWSSEIANASAIAVSACRTAIDAAGTTRQTVQARLDAAIVTKQKEYDDAQTARTNADMAIILRTLDVAIVADQNAIVADTDLLNSVRASASMQALLAQLNTATGAKLEATHASIEGELNALKTQSSILQPDLQLAAARAGFAQGQANVARLNQSMANGDFVASQEIKVVQYYQVLLGRGPTVQEYADAIVAMKIAGGLDSLAERLMSKNPRIFPAQMSNDDFVKLIYRNGLNRDFSRDPDGLRFWTDKLGAPASLTRAQLVSDILRSFIVSNNSDTANFENLMSTRLSALATAFWLMPSDPALYKQSNANALHAAEALADQGLPASAMATQETELAQLYVGLFGRKPDPAGFLYWLSKVHDGTPLEVVAQAMLSNGSEGSHAYPASLTNDEFVRQLFQNGLGRTASDAEVQQYAQLAANRGRGVAALAIIRDAVNYTGGGLAEETVRNRLNGLVDSALRSIAADPTNFMGDLQLAKATLKTMDDAAPWLHTVGQVASADLAVNGTREVNRGFDKYEVDRWGNVVTATDERNHGWKTTYTYDANNQLLSTTVPDAGAGANTSSIAYDELGRQVRTEDALHHVNLQHYDTAGNLAEVNRADGSKATYGYDTFGERTSTFQGFYNLTNTGTTGGLSTTYKYDKLGHMTSSESESVDVYTSSDLNGNGSYNDMLATNLGSLKIVTTYTYDELGRQTSIAVGDNGAGHVPLTRNATRYDLSGNVIKTSNVDHATSNSYDAFNRLVWRFDPTGKNVSTWEYADDGRLVSYAQLSGSKITYTYSAAGQVLTQKSTAVYVTGAQDLSYSYDSVTGRLIGIDDKVLDKQTTYGYDAAGNRVLEQTTQKGVIAQDQKIEFDAQGRMWKVHSNVSGANYEVVYTYDAAGNRKNVTTSYTSDSGTDNFISVENRFDELNRQVYSAITATATKRSLSVRNPKLQQEYEDYQTVTVKSETDTVRYDGVGNRIEETVVKSGGSTGSTSTNSVYSYDALGRLSTVYRGGQVVGYRHYDAAGRVIESLDNNQVMTYAYDQYGNMLRQRVTGTGGHGDYKYDIYYTGRNGVALYDEVGNVLGYDVVNKSADRNSVDKHYDLAYNMVGDGWKLGTETVRSISSGTAATTTNNYDANGNLARVDVGGATPSVTTLINDAQGKVLSRKAGSTVTHSLIANDQLIGSSDNGFESFSTSFEPVTSAAMTAAPSVYTVQGGETLESIAKAVWGDSTLWYLIADANGGMANTGPVAGSQLAIPTRASSTRNDFQSFKAYDPSKAVGDTTPTLADPSAGGGGGKCGTLGKVLLVVVAVVVTVYTAGLMSNASGALMSTLSTGATALAGGSAAAGIGALGFAGGAIAGAAGSIASQAFGNATGITEGFDWRGVALSALSAGMGAGVGAYGAANSSSILNMSNPGAIMARAATTAALTQGVAVATGLQSSFSWRSVAASAAGAVAGSQVSTALGGSSVMTDVFGEGTTRKLVDRTVTSFASGLTTAVFKGGKVSVQQVAVDAFGNALGNSLALNSAGGSQQVVGSGAVRSSGSSGASASGTDIQRVVDNYFAAGDRNALALGQYDTSDLDLSIDVGDGVLPRIPSVSLPQFSISAGGLSRAGVSNELRSSGDLRGYSTYWGFATDKEGIVVENRGGSTYHMTQAERVDNLLSRAQGSVASYFGQMDDLASSANATTGAQIFAAATYGVRKIASDTISGLIGLPRLITSNTIVPGMFNVAAHPLQATRSIITNFGNMPVQDRLITGLEMALPFKGNIESLAGRLPRAGKFLEGTFSYSTDYGVTLTAGDATYGFLGDGVGNGLPGKWGNQVGAVEIPRIGRIDIPSGLQGSGSVLAENMGGVPEGYQAHHLVMSSLAQKSEALQYLAKQGLYDVNRASNGLGLPGNEFLALADEMPLHSGYHGAEYRAAVSDGLNRLDAALQRGASDANLLMRIDRLEQSLSSRVLNGDLWLNNRDAQLRNLGPFK